jgi:hypothetical protein
MAVPAVVMEGHHQPWHIVLCFLRVMAGYACLHGIPFLPDIIAILIFVMAVCACRSVILAVL